MFFLGYKQRLFLWIVLYSWEAHFSIYNALIINKNAPPRKINERENTQGLSCLNVKDRSDCKNKYLPIGRMAYLYCSSENVESTQS